jgi:uncharacterized membrane protein
MENSKAKFHLFNIWALVDEFKAGQVDEELKFKYLLASAIFISLLLSLLIMPGEETQTVWWFDTVSSLLITILGIQLAYQKNKSGDNTDFVARYTAIGFVLTSLSLALYLALLLVSWKVLHLKRSSLVTRTSLLHLRSYSRLSLPYLSSST